MMSSSVCSLEILVRRPRLILIQSWMQIWTPSSSLSFHGTNLRSTLNEIMEGRVSASPEWLINGLRLSYSQLAVPQTKWHGIHLHAKTPISPLAFPQGSIFHAGFLCRAFCPVSFLMGITLKPLSFWTALWPVLSVLWLNSKSDSQIECTNGSGGKPDSARALFSLFFTLSVLCCHSQIFLLSHFSSSLLCFSFVCTLFDDHISLSALFVARKVPHWWADKLHPVLIHSLNLASIYVCALSDILTIPTRAAIINYYNYRLVSHWVFVWSIKCQIYKAL